MAKVFVNLRFLVISYFQKLDILQFQVFRISGISDFCKFATLRYSSRSFFTLSGVTMTLLSVAATQRRARAQGAAAAIKRARSPKRCGRPT